VNKLRAEIKRKKQTAPAIPCGAVFDFGLPSRRLMLRIPIVRKLAILEMAFLSCAGSQ
jgi:hypothetical protein